jgi:hypothetical protein
MASSTYKSPLIVGAGQRLRGGRLLSKERLAVAIAARGTANFRRCAPKQGPAPLAPTQGEVEVKRLFAEPNRDQNAPDVAIYNAGALDMYRPELRAALMVNECPMAKCFSPHSLSLTLLRAARPLISSAIKQPLAEDRPSPEG